jgi:integrase/recombinase XerD
MQLSTTVTRFLSEQQGIVSPSTTKWYTWRLQLLNPLYDSSLGAISTDDLRKIWQQLAQRDLSPYTLFGIIVAWRSFFNWCVRNGHLTSSPAAGLKKPPLPDEPPKAVSQDDLTRMIRESQSNPRDYAIICFLADTGCRVGGLVGLCIKDVDLERARAVVHEKGLGGKSKTRTVYMKPRTVQTLRDYLDTRGQTGPFLFYGEKGHLTDCGVRQMLERVAKRARVKGRCNPHAFRHGFARGALDNGLDLATLAQLMGHADVSTTARFYARWSDEELKRKHDKVSWLPNN